MSLKMVQSVKGSAPKSIRSRMDTLLISPAVVKKWKLPPFQRPLRTNDKVRALGEELRQSGGVIPGILTLGVIAKDEYLIDGQHRVEAFKLANLPEGIADVRVCQFDSMAEMGEEFVNLNSSLVRMRPDDVLRGLEGTLPGLGVIRKHCNFVGYDQIRRGSSSSPVISMSSVLRCWFGSSTEVPGAGGNGSAAQMARGLTEDEAMQIVGFLTVAHDAWGRDQEYFRLWGALNVCVSMWLWRRTVISAYSAKSVRLTAALFGKCLMQMSATSDYSDWLVGRQLGDRDRSPCYARIKAIFFRRLDQEQPGKKAYFPSPAWHSNSGR